MFLLTNAKIGIYTDIHHSNGFKEHGQAEQPKTLIFYFLGLAVTFDLNVKDIINFVEQIPYLHSVTLKYV